MTHPAAVLDASLWFADLVSTLSRAQGRWRAQALPPDTIEAFQRTSLIASAIDDVAYEALVDALQSSHQACLWFSNEFAQRERALALATALETRIQTELESGDDPWRSWEESSGRTRRAAGQRQTYKANVAAG